MDAGGTAEPRRESRLISLSDATAVLALGGVALYVVGLVRTIGLLRADGVDVKRGIPLAPLQDYLLRGLGVIVAPSSLEYMAVGGLLLALVLTSPRWRPLIAQGRSAEHAGDILVALGAIAVMQLGLIPTVADQLALLPLMLIPGSFALFVSPAELIPLVVPIVFLGAAAEIASRRGVLPDDWRSWTRSHARVATAGVAAWLLLTTLLAAYLIPPPLDRATIETTSGEHLAGDLLTLTGSAAYLIEDGKRARIRVIPTASMRSLWMSSGRPRHYRSIADRIGIHIVK